MAIYVISLLTGYETTGVDIAQGRRDAALQEMHVPVKYIFMSLPEEKYIAGYENFGISRKHMLSAELYYCGITSLDGEVPADRIAAEVAVKLHITEEKKYNDKIVLYKKGAIAAQINMRRGRCFAEACSSVMYFKNGYLLQEDVYADRILYSKFFATRRNEKGSLFAQLILKQIRKPDGQVGLEIHVDDGKEYYCLPSHQRVTYSAFLEAFFQKLALTKQDLLLIDRPLYMNYMGSLLKNKRDAKMVLFLHSGHYFKKNESPTNVFYNNEYMKLFSMPQLFDGVIVSTQEQKEDLINDFAKIGKRAPEIYVCPVNGIESVPDQAKKRRPYSLITASRIDMHKGIDLMIRAAAIAHQQLPKLTLDIYGAGFTNYENTCRQLIEQLDAKAYIHMKGYQEVGPLYQNYEAYITASTFESFGLGLLEAASAGDALIGFDVRYGNHLFIKNGVNGISLPIDLDKMNSDDYRESVAERMAEGIIDLFSDQKTLEQYQYQSYELSKGYEKDIINVQWTQILHKIMENKNTY